MSSLLDVRLGAQEPTILHLPPDVVSLDAADDLIELANAYTICDGNPLSESQEITLRAACGERADGSWAASTVADFGPRQGTGKSDKINAREFGGLILFGERLIIHTAHEFPTANECFLRMVAIFENWDDLRKKVARIRYANGEQGIELKTGQRLKYRARTGGSGRGFTKADLIVYDEAQHLRREHVAASGPAKLANPNSQSWFAGSGGLSTSEVAWELRKKAILGNAGRLAYTEMTGESIEVVDGRITYGAPDPTDRDAWYAVMPGLGRWVTEEGVEALQTELGDLFAREALCVWDPLPSDAAGEAKLPAEAWAATVRPDSKLPKPERGKVTVTFAVDRDGVSAATAVGLGSLAEPCVEVEAFEKGTGWLPAAVVALVRRWEPLVVACNGAGATGAQVGPVIAALREAGLDTEVVQLGAKDWARACQGFFVDVVEGRLVRPDGQGPLDVAAGDATERPVGDGWAWDAKQATVALSPLEAVTAARAVLPAEVLVSEVWAV